MEKQFEIYGGDATVTYTETEEKKKLVWDRIILFCQKHNITSSEDQQNDNFNIYSPILIGDILDEIIRFETHWK